MGIPSGSLCGGESAMVKNRYVSTSKFIDAENLLVSLSS